jgi:hypothetical protein
LTLLAGDDIKCRLFGLTYIQPGALTHMNRVTTHLAMLISHEDAACRAVLAVPFVLVV